MNYFIYILRCADDSYYTGITTDLERRVFEHNTKKTGAKYTNTRRPVHLVYQEISTNRSEAQKREHVLRKLSRAEKQVLEKEFIRA